MKKVLYTVAALAILAACQKEAPVVEKTTPESKSTLNFDLNVSEPGDVTKAVKHGWETGDKLDIWFDWLVQGDNADFSGSDAEKAAARTPDLILSYSGTGWVVDTQADNLEARLKTDGTGRIYALWESYNDFKDWNHGFSSRPNSTNTGVVYFGVYNVPQYTTDNPHYYHSPQIFTAGFGIDTYTTTDSGYALNYTYDPATNTVTSDLNIWRFFTDFQVTVAGLPDDNYILKGNHFCLFDNVYWGESLNHAIMGQTGANWYAAPAYTSDTHENGLRFFGYLDEAGTDNPATHVPASGRELDYTFTLRSLTSGLEYNCTKEKKTLVANEKKMAAIKLHFSDFNYWAVVGDFNDWGNTQPEIVMKRISAIDDSKDPLYGTWVADIDYTQYQEFKLRANGDYNQGEAGMKKDWDYYSLGTFIDSYLAAKYNDNHEVINKNIL